MLPAITLRGGAFAQTLIADFVGPDGLALPTQPAADLAVALRPAALCPAALCLSADPREPAYLVTPSFRTLAGETLLDPAALVPALRTRLGRPAADVRVTEGCLPRGRDQIDLLYPSGQRRALPDEAGVGVGAEAERGGDRCVEPDHRPRTKLGSQAAFVAVGDERQAGYCAALHPSDGALVAGVPRACLRPDELAAAAK